MLYSTDKSKRFLAPAQDVINTVIYLPKDKPALNLFGKRLWFSKKELIKFGVQNCLLAQKEAESIIESAIQAVQKTIVEIEEYITTNQDFKEFGEQFIKILTFSIEHFDTSYKDLSNEIF